MVTFKTLISKFSIITLISTILSSSAFATGGQITFTIQGAPINPTAVPTLSGTMLVILSLLLFAVAFRIAKQKNTRAGKFFIALLGVTAIASGSGGVKLVSDTYAGLSTTPIQLPDTGIPITLNPDQFYVFENILSDSLNIFLQADEGSTCGTFGPTPSGIPVCSSGSTLAPDTTCHIECRSDGPGPNAE